MKAVDADLEVSRSLELSTPLGAVVDIRFRTEPDRCMLCLL